MADQAQQNYHSPEFEELKQEIEQFKHEKERVRGIVGRVGGMPQRSTRILNVIFVLLIAVPLGVSLFSRGVVQLAMIEIATASVSAKILYLIHMQSRVNHFQLWILTSLEWRLNEMGRQLGELQQGANT